MSSTVETKLQESFTIGLTRFGVSEHDDFLEADSFFALLSTSFICLGGDIDKLHLVDDCLDTGGSWDILRLDCFEFVYFYEVFSLLFSA